jgi:hypothetical protein
MKDFGLNCVKGTAVRSAAEAEKIANAYYAFSGKTRLHAFSFNLYAHLRHFLS